MSDAESFGHCCTHCSFNHIRVTDSFNHDPVRRVGSSHCVKALANALKEVTVLLLKSIKVAMSESAHGVFV
jgi:hypothetical protein